MKAKIIHIILLVFLIQTSASYAADLSDYPDFLFEDNKLNVTLVSGDKSSSINVIAQSAISSSLASIGKGNPKNMLASEVENLGQSIISIGSPCVNQISAAIMGNPVPCSRDFQEGKALIKLYDEGDYYHIIVAGSTDEGTRKAAEILANFDGYNLQGDEFLVSFEEPDEEVLEPREEDDYPSDEETIEEDEVPKDSINVYDEPENDEPEKNDIQEAKNDGKPAENQVQETKPESQDEDRQGLINRFVSWIISLFT